MQGEDEASAAKADESVSDSSKTAQGQQQNNQAVEVQNESQANGYPAAQVKVVDLESSQFADLGAFKLAATTKINASLKVCNQSSVDLVSFNKDEFTIAAKNEVIKIFSNLKLQKPLGILKKMPTASISNTYGEYKFSLCVTSQTPNTTILFGNISKTSKIENGEWNLLGSVTMEMLIKLEKNQNLDIPSQVSLHSSEASVDNLKGLLQNFDGTFTTTLKEVTPIEEVAVVAIMLLAAPLGV